VTAADQRGESRRRARHLRVPVNAEEAMGIEAHAREVGMSIAAYLRAVGLGYQPRAVVDHEKLHEMLRINGDLGRLGGLLKLWLTDDSKLAGYDQAQLQLAIRSALRRIERTQEQLQGIVRQALRDGGDR
jgi:hypothetical protein